MSIFDRPILEHIGIGVPRERYAATVRFYERVLRWRRVRETPGELVFLGDGKGGRLAIYIEEGAPLSAPHHLAFAISLREFDRLLTTLREAGAALEAPYTNAFGDQTAFFTDPAGNRCQLTARLEALPR